MERLICSSAAVSDLDARLAAAYQELLDSAGGGATLVRDQQREWLRVRNACGSVECMKEQYVKRLSQLGEFTRPAPTSHWEPMNVVTLPAANGHTYYADFMDRTSLRKAGKLRSIWTLSNYTEPQSFRDNKSYDFVEYRSVKTMEYYDCAQGKKAEARDEFFSGEMGGGSLVLSAVYTTSTEKLRWAKVDLQGEISSRVRLVCGL